MTKKQPAKTPVKKPSEKAKKPTKRLLSEEELVVEEVPVVMETINPFSVKEYPDFKKELELSEFEKAKIKKLEEFFSFEKPQSFNMPKLNLDAKAYPNNDEYINIPGAHDTQKWLETVKAIYTAEQNGQAREYFLPKITSGWGPTEKYDFLNWLKFYEENAHLKYKTAQQQWYENDLPGYILPYKTDPAKQDIHVGGRDIDYAREAIVSEMPVAEKKRIIENQRRKIVGRLDSTEKLLRSEEGQMLAGKEFETLIEVIYALKKKLQLVNKISTSTKLYEDMIVREANVLNKNGFTKAANVLYKFADETASKNAIPSAAEPAKEPALAATPPAPPAQPSGAPGGLPATPPGVAPKSEGINNFLSNLDTSKITEKDKQAVEDELFVEDHEGELIVEAQEAPLPEPVAPPAAPVENPIEVEEPVSEALVDPAIEPEDTVTEDTTESLKAKNFDAMIGRALSNLKIDDVVAKLEDLAKVFKTREIPRQLSIIDMMLDSLGLASFFPSLSEATNKALESNNYISTRVEDVLSKLRGSMKTNDIDLKNGEGEKAQSPEVEGMKASLKNKEDKENSRKEMRKNLADEALEDQTKETPDVEIDEDLAPETPPAEAPVAPPAFPPKPAV